MIEDTPLFSSASCDGKVFAATSPLRASTEVTSTAGSDRVTADDILRLIAGVVLQELLTAVGRELEVLVNAEGVRATDDRVGGRNEERGTMVKLEVGRLLGNSPLRRQGGVGRVEFRWWLLDRRGLLRPSPELARLCLSDRESVVSIGVWFVA